MISAFFKIAFASLICFTSIIFASQSTNTENSKHIIIYVWDGLRPDSVTPETTPTLYNLMKSGTEFTDNHASYPTFTMMNAASFATGDRAGKTGFFGNTLWHPGLEGTDSANNPIDFSQPVFTEDYKVLQSLNKDKLFFVNTLFNAAHEKNLTTAAVGKTGAAFMQDYLAHGLTLDEKHAHPLSFAKQLQDNGYALPVLSPYDFAPGELTLADGNGTPTNPDKINFLSDNATTDPSDQHGSPYNNSNEYMANIFFKEIVSKKLPQISVLWMRNPDTTEHHYGPGTANYLDALQSNDKILQRLLTTLKNHHLDTNTDIIIVSDHAHSTVSGPLNLFPLRDITEHQVGAIHTNGYSVSGDIRTADLLTRAGFHAYDGVGCLYNPVLSGIKSNNTPLYPTQIDETGDICGEANKKYTTRAYKVPKNLPNDAIIVAANGGSDYLYIPSHDKSLVKRIVTFLASHEQYDAIFTSSTLYGQIDGTVPLESIGIENPEGRSPDIIVGLSYDADAQVNGLPGIEFSDSANLRGMHGSFSPIDVHNFMMAYGPDFRKNYQDTLPTGNMDLAPTVAYLLGLKLPNTDGRVLFEALSNAKRPSYHVIRYKKKAEKPLSKLTIYNALNDISSNTSFTTIVYAKVLTNGSSKYYYFDKAEGMRQTH